MDRREIDEHFFERQPIPGLRFAHNDPVRVLAGPHAGTLGCVVAVRALGPDPELLVESASGEDLVVLQSHLAPA